jgi:HSP20 family protein
MDKKSPSFGLDGMFRGLGQLLQLAADASTKDARAGYGVSVRIGGVRAPARRTHVVEDTREPMVDVFDEGDHYLVVGELPGVAEPAAHWSVREGQWLTVAGTAGARRYHKDLRLAERVASATAQARFENGVLELRLWKES